MPPARMTARAEETMSWKWGEGSRSWYLRVMSSWVVVVGEEVGLLKNSWPSFEG